MERKINRFGEVSYSKNEALVTMPFSRLDTENTEFLEENYRQKIKDLEYTDSFFYANYVGVIRDRLQMSYDLEGCIDFYHIHKLKLNDMLPFLYSMINIAKQNVNVLWERNNFAIDLTEKKVKAIIFEFEGFPIYKKDTNVDGLKELILLALTKNHSILGKPKRADFIEKTEKVYQFADDIISSKSVEEVKNVVDSYEREMEYEELKKEKEIAEKSKNKIFNKLIKRKKKQVKENPSDVLKRNLNTDMNDSKGKKGNKTFIEKMTSPKGMVITGISVALLFIITSFLESTNSVSSEELAKEKEQLQVTNETLDAYRLYSTHEDENIEKAYAKLDNIGYDKLPPKDKETLINWYIEQEKYTKAITTRADSSYLIADTIIENEKENDSAINKLEQLEASFPDDPVLKFDIASLKGQYQVIVENSSLNEFNDRRAVALVKAYVLTNQIDELEEIIDSFKEKEESYDVLTKYSEKYLDRYIEKRELVNEQNSMNDQLENLEEKLEESEDKKEKKFLKGEIKEVKSELKLIDDRIDAIDENIIND